MALELRLLDNAIGNIPATTVAVLDILLSRKIAEIENASNVAKPDCNDATDMIAFDVALVALPEINDCAVLSELLDNDALPLVNTVDGLSTLTDTVARPEVELLVPIERMVSVVANPEVVVVTGRVTLDATVALAKRSDDTS